MNADQVPPSWRLPEGVNASLWQYAHSSKLAEEEDGFFEGHPLFEADREALDARLKEPCKLVDLGCGAGRLAIHFARRGFEVTAVELSQAMLGTVGAKAAAEGLKIRRVRANLCRLGCFPTGSFRVAIAMFSTFGMIRGARARRRAVAEAFQVLEPGGGLVLHAHNLWLNLRDPQGRSWLAGQGVRALLGRVKELGDRRMMYRGIPGMEVHLYRWGELRGDLEAAGFQIAEALSIDAVSARPIRWPWLWPSVRAGGWIVVATKPDQI